MEQYTPIIYTRFAGLNEDENPSSLADNELSKANNTAHYGWLLGTRPGLEYEGSGEDYDASLTGGVGTNDASITLMHDFSQKTNFTNDRRANNGSILLTASEEGAGNTTAFWTDNDIANVLPIGAFKSGTANRNDVWVAATHRDAVFLAGGPSTADFGYWTYQTSTPPTGNVTAVVIPNIAGTQSTGTPKYVFTKSGNVFAAGFNPSSGDTDNSYNKMVVRYHSVGTDPKLAANWPTKNTIGTGAQIGDLGGLADYGDEYITGLGEYDDPNGSWLMVLTNLKLVSVARSPATGEFVIDDAIANGCVHQRAFVQLGRDAGDSIYMSDHGIHSLKQSLLHGQKADTFLSWKIRKTFEDLDPTRLDKACGAYDDVEGWVLFAVTSSSGGNSNDKILCLDIKNSKSLTSEEAVWHVWTLSPTYHVNSMAQVRDAQGKRRIYVGTVDDGSGNASVGRFTRDQYQDFDTGYNMVFRTGYNDNGTSATEKSHGNMYLNIGPAGSYSPTLKAFYDFGARTGTQKSITLPGISATNWDNATFTADDAGVWDNFNWGDLSVLIRQTKLYMVGRYFNIAHEFAHSGTNEPVFFAGFVQEASVIGESRAA